MADLPNWLLKLFKKLGILLKKGFIERPYSVACMSVSRLVGF
jgi:hypothetical protein